VLARHTTHPSLLPPPRALPLLQPTTTNTNTNKNNEQASTCMGDHKKITRPSPAGLTETTSNSKATQRKRGRKRRKQTKQPYILLTNGIVYSCKLAPATYSTIPKLPSPSHRGLTPPLFSTCRHPQTDSRERHRPPQSRRNGHTGPLLAQIVGSQWLIPRTLDLAFTRYCHHQYCRVNGIQRRGRWGVYIAQWSCSSIAIG